jgi:hypothetical protein
MSKRENMIVIIGLSEGIMGRRERKRMIESE